MASFVQAELLGSQGGPDRSQTCGTCFLGEPFKKAKEGLRDGRCPKCPKVYKAK